MIRPKEQSDSDLLRRMGAGDQEAFRTIYQRCQGPIYRFALHMTGNTFLAEDVTQEVFMMLIEDAGRFDPARGTLPAYLFGIGRNLLLQRLNREQVFVPFLDSGPSNGATHRNNGAHPVLVVPPPDLVRGETIDRVRQAVFSLPPNYREVVVLCDLQDMSYEEASRVLDCAVGTVRSRLHRARALLTEKLREFRNSAPSPAPNPAQRSVAGGQAKS
jgi:RNA polymerase sigma-70 factor (ECF subfamily)